MSELKKVALRLEAEDVETFQKFYGHLGGYNKAIRALVHRHAKTLREHEAQKIRPQIDAMKGDNHG